MAEPFESSKICNDFTTVPGRFSAAHPSFKSQFSDPTSFTIWQIYRSNERVAELIQIDNLPSDSI